METQLQIFKNPDFGDVRKIVRNGEPWFVAANVCRALDVDSTATRRLDDDEKGLHSTQTLGGEQNMTIVNEPDSFRLDELQRMASAMNISISQLPGETQA